MRDLIDRLLESSELTHQEIEFIFAKMLAGELSDAEIAAVLAAWRLRGEGPDELYAGAVGLRRHAASIALPDAARPLVDNCGTGGDGAGSFNLSTAAAIVAASAGARVAKHGNRSVSSRCGSADLLFAAGFPDTLTPAGAGRLLETTGFTFFFAPSFHQVMRHVAPVRKALGVRTIFNLLGPLANPIAPEYQLIGVGAHRYLRPMAETLARLGVRRALVVHSRDGLDELSPAAATDMLLVEGDHITEMVVEPATLGVKATLADLAGGDASQNLVILRRLLDGEANGVAEAVALNAGAVLWLAEHAATLAEGVALARRHIASRTARSHFDAWIASAQALVP